VDANLLRAERSRIHRPLHVHAKVGGELPVHDDKLRNVAIAEMLAQHMARIERRRLRWQGLRRVPGQDNPQRPTTVLRRQRFELLVDRRRHRLAPRPECSVAVAVDVPRPGARGALVVPKAAL
jgi:hypothetical protein